MRETRSNIFATRPGGTILMFVATRRGQKISILLKNEQKEDVPKKVDWGIHYNNVPKVIFLQAPEFSG
jgi:hypothetical protein